MWDDLLRAICLMLVLEGVMPFLYPGRWRQMVATLAVTPDHKLRLMGLCSMALGAGLLFLLK